MEKEAYVGNTEPIEGGVGGGNFAIHLVVFVNTSELSDIYKRIQEHKIRIDIK